MIDQLPPTTISTRQLQELSQNGVLVIDDFLYPQMVRDMLGAVESLEADSRSSRIRRGVSFARRNLLELDFVRTLIQQRSVREFINAIDPGLRAVRAILFDKSGSANWTVPWHQDRSIAVRERIDTPGFGPWSMKAGVAHVQPPIEILKQMLTLRIHLDSCGSDNGPLRVIAKTHNRILDQDEIKIAVAKFAQNICVTGAGGLVLMRPLVLHASSPAKEVSHRRVFHIEFGPPVLPGGLHWAISC